MEDQRFDAFARSLAGRVSRRTAMKAGIISALGGLVAVGSSTLSTEAAACSGLGTRCTKDSACCSGHCDTATGTCTCGTGTVQCNGNCLTACPAGQLLTGDCKCVCVSFSEACGSVCCGSGQTCCSSACTNTQTSTMNCGTCGHVCPTGPNVQTVTCIAGTCGITCNTGFADCNHNPTDGCEINISTDLNNCGGCGFKCSNLNCTPTCTSGVCVPTCNSGFANCISNPAGGCETNTNTNVNNCGGCGVVCSSNNIPTPTCSASVCTGTCAAGFADCNGNKQSDGCETNISTDPNNCGGCGIACSPTQTCSNGVCG
jgi:hypothetical protein